jgi:hypothetical protein
MTGDVMLCDGRKSMIARSCRHRLPERVVFASKAVTLGRQLPDHLVESFDVIIAARTFAAARLHVRKWTLWRPIGF